MLCVKVRDEEGQEGVQIARECMKGGERDRRNQSLQGGDNGGEQSDECVLFCQRPIKDKCLVRGHTAVGGPNKKPMVQ